MDNNSILSRLDRHQFERAVATPVGLPSLAGPNIGFIASQLKGASSNAFHQAALAAGGLNDGAGSRPDYGEPYTDALFAIRMVIKIEASFGTYNWFRNPSWT